MKLLFVDHLIQKAILSTVNSQYVKGLAILRILLGLFFLSYYKIYFGWIADIPQELFHPHTLNFIRLFGGFPPSFLVGFFDTILVFAILGIVLGVRSRISSAIAFVIFLFMNGFAFAIGKIDHAFVFNLLLLALAFSNAGTVFALVPDRILSDRTVNRITAIYGFILAFGLFTAGTPKVIGWIDFDLTTSGVLRWYYNGFYSYGRTGLLAPFFGKIPPAFLEPLDYFVPLFESAGIFALFINKRYWNAWLYGLCVFHTANTLILNIPFEAHVFVYGFWLLPSLLDRILVNGKVMLVSVGTIGGILALNHLVGRIFYDRISWIEVNHSLNVDLVLWLLLLIVSIPHLVRFFRFRAN